MRDLETIIVLVLLAFNFIPQRSHHSPTLPRSRVRDSATAGLTPGDGTTAIKVEWKKALRSTGQTITGPIYQPSKCVYPDISAIHFLKRNSSDSLFITLIKVRCIVFIHYRYIKFTIKQVLYNFMFLTFNVIQKLYRQALQSVFHSNN